MWFYSFIFLILIALNSLAYFYKISNIGYVISLFILFIIAALRPSSCCADYSTYVEYYNNLSEISLTFLEPSFFVIAWLSKQVFHGYIGVFIIYSILGVSIKGYALKRLTKYYGVSLILYFGSYFLLHEMTQIRVGVAAAILLASIPYIEQRKSLAFFSSIIIGCLFHYSLIIFSIFYFINPYTINKKIYTISIFFILLATVLGLNIINLFQYIKLGFLSQKIEAYQVLLEQGMFGDISLLNPLLFLRILILLFFIWKSDVVIVKNRYSIIVTKIYAFSIFSFIALSPLPVLAGRVSQLLGVVEIVLVPYAIYILKPKYAAIVILVIFALMIMYKQLFYSDLMSGYFN